MGTTILGTIRPNFASSKAGLIHVSEERVAFIGASKAFSVVLVYGVMRI